MENSRLNHFINIPHKTFQHKKGKNMPILVALDPLIAMRLMLNVDRYFNITQCTNIYHTLFFPLTFCHTAHSTTLWSRNQAGVGALAVVAIK
jgi:hypothetical protein